MTFLAWPLAALLLAAADTPGPRDAAQMMTYDSSRKQALLFGGSGPTTTLGGLWAWDGRDWKLLADGGPTPRNSGVLVYDSRRKRTILFGGRDVAGKPLSDTWEWDGVRWRATATQGPTPNVHATAAFDRKHGVVVLFGPVFEPDRMPRPLPSETWTWNGRRWTRRAAWGPVDCLPVGMVYDPVRQAVLLMTTGIEPETTGLWQWDGKAWQPAETTPSFAPSASALVSSASGPLVFDGKSGTTWQNQASRWTDTHQPGPPPRSGHALAFDEARRKVVLFGGTRVTANIRERLSDTWEWNGQSWRRAH